ncbi:hypothetical protein ACHAWT_007173 [Skeletonema menzelii]
MKIKALLLSSSFLATGTQGFVATMPCAKAFTQLRATTIDCPAVAEGEREIIDGPKGPVLVAKVAGSYYAVDATCPHLNLPMKKGKIEVDGGKATITCNFHNSCFDMKTGKCDKWVTGALGVENGFVSGLMNKVGGEKSDIVAYYVTEKEDGSLTVSSEAPIVEVGGPEE